MTHLIPTESDLREAICRVGALMHQKGFIDGTAGNISARLDDRRIIATPSGLSKGQLTPDHLLTVDMDGQRVDDPTVLNAELHPTSELLMHLECYRQRPDVQAVVHAHPQTAIALTIAGHEFNQFLIPEIVIFMGIVAVTPYATPSGAENRDAITRLIHDHDVILLAHHGSLTVGKSVWDAYYLLESLEHNAEILLKVHQFGGAKSSIPPEKIRALLELRQRFGFAKPADQQHFAKYLNDTE